MFIEATDISLKIKLDSIKLSGPVSYNVIEFMCGGGKHLWITEYNTGFEVSNKTARRCYNFYQKRFEEQIRASNDSSKI